LNFKKKFQFGAKGRYQDWTPWLYIYAYVISQRTGSGLKEPPNTDL
jgi:hypothetical protein